MNLEDEAVIFAEGVAIVRPEDKIWRIQYLFSQLLWLAKEVLS